MIPVIAAYFLILITHLALVFFQVVPGALQVVSGIDAFLAVIFSGALLIAMPGVNKGGETFVQRFLIITTVQLLTMLGLIIVLTFSKVTGAKALGFSSIILFMILLVIQSVFLVNKIKKN